MGGMAGIVFYECERVHCQLSFLDLLTLLSVLERAMLQGSRSTCYDPDVHRHQ